MQGARTQKEFRDDGMYGPIHKAAGTMGSYGDVRSQQDFRNQGMYSQINAAMGTQNPKATYWNRGSVNGLGAVDPLRGPLDARTQAAVRQGNLYSNLYASVGKQQPKATYWNRGSVSGLGDSLHSPMETRSPAGFVAHGMYKNLYNAARPKSLAGYLGQAVSTTAPGIMVVLAIVVIYYLFFNKKEDQVEAEGPVGIGSSEDEGANFYY